MICFSLRENRPSQDPQGDLGGQGSWVVHQDAEHDRRQGPLHPERGARSGRHTNTQWGQADTQTHSEVKQTHKHTVTLQMRSCVLWWICISVFEGSSEELSLGLQIGSLATPVKRQLELYLCKKVGLPHLPYSWADVTNQRWLLQFCRRMFDLTLYFLSAIKEKPKSIDIQDRKINNVCENSVNQNLQVSLPGKEEKIKALNQQVDSLQHVILQVRLNEPHNQSSLNSKTN